MGPLLYVQGHMRLLSYLKTFVHKNHFFKAKPLTNKLTDISIV